MRYLYTGGLSPGGWDEARLRILEGMGRSVRTVRCSPYLRSLGRRIGNLQSKLGWGPGIRRYNRALLAAAAEHRPDVFWVDKGDLMEVGRLGHRMKGTVAYLGAHSTMDAAQRVEQFCKSNAGTRAEAEQAVNVLDHACRELKAALTEHPLAAEPKPGE